MTRRAAEEAFDVLVSPTETLGPTEFAFELPDGWQQGRGLFGGLIIGCLIRAMERVVADPERSLRSLTAELCGPTQPGPMTVKVEVLRAGNAVSTLAARVLQSGEVQAHAVGVFGKARSDTRQRVDLAPLALPDWRAVEAAALAPPVGPDFSKYFEFRPVSGLPYSGEAAPRTACFVKPLRPGTARDAAWVVACADTCWPGVLVIDEAPRPMATITFSLEFIAPMTGLDPEAPLFHRATTVSIRDGYAVELRELWGADGRLVALNQQTFVIIR